MNTTRIGFLTAAFTIAIVSTWITGLNAADCDCPSCGVKICIPEVEQQKVKKTTFSVEEKDVCIPRFNWPWQKCCPPKCGHVRTVCVLKKGSRECESCGYKWEFTTVEGVPTRSCNLKSKGLGIHKLWGSRSKDYDTGCATGCATGWESSSPYNVETHTLEVPSTYEGEANKKAIDSVLQKKN